MICVVSHDAGGAEIISSYVRRNQIDYKFVLNGPAVSIFERKLGKLNIQDLEEAVSTSDFLLCGTSWQSDIEWQAIAMARAAGKTSVAFLDHWVNYSERFTRGGITHLPDEIWVGDALAESMAQNLFPGVTIILVENPYFNDLKKELDEFMMPQECDPGGLRILYVCEPIREHALRNYGNEHHWGYTEEGAIRFFLANTDLLGAPIGRIVIRPHPSEPSGKYDWVSQEYDLRIMTGGAISLIKEVAASDVVVGCESMAMVVGLLAGRRVISCIPPGGKPCELPQPEIEKMQEILTRK
jgi:hypothetical protein